jgi:hypothetical protein
VDASDRALLLMIFGQVNCHVKSCSDLLKPTRDLPVVIGMYAAPKESLNRDFDLCKNIFDNVLDAYSL